MSHFLKDSKILPCCIVFVECTRSQDIKGAIENAKIGGKTCIGIFLFIFLLGLLRLTSVYRKKKNMKVPPQNKISEEEKAQKLQLEINSLFIKYEEQGNKENTKKDIFTDNQDCLDTENGISKEDLSEVQQQISIFNKGDSEHRSDILEHLKNIDSILYTVELDDEEFYDCKEELDNKDNKHEQDTLACKGK